MTTVQLVSIAFATAVIALLCAIRLYLRSRKKVCVHVSSSDSNRRPQCFTINVRNQKSHPVTVLEVGFHLVEQPRPFRRMKFDEEGQWRGTIIEPGEDESWTFSRNLFLHPDFEGKGAVYVRLDSGKPIKGRKVDLSSYRGPDNRSVA